MGLRVTSVAGEDGAAFTPAGRSAADLLPWREPGQGFLGLDVQPDGKGTPSEHRAANALIRLADVGLLG